MKTIETYLPIFSGFYGSWYESDLEHKEEMELEYYQDNYCEDIEYDDLDFDYEDFYSQCAEGIFYGVFDELVSRDLIKDMTFEKLSSPKYYNFANDSIYVTITLQDKNVSAIMSYLNGYIEDFTEYIKDNYTSRDGFISSYSNDVQEWLCEESLEHSHKLGSILNFILTNDGYNEEELFDYVMEYHSPMLSIKNDINDLILHYE